MVTLAVLTLFAVLAGLWGVDSRPGFDGRSDRSERWFIHDRHD
jgi:hypothetical protein